MLRLTFASNRLFAAAISLFSLFVGCENSSNEKNSLLDVSMPPKERIVNGLWDLNELYLTPNYRIVDSGNVYGLMFETMMLGDTMREAFAYYSNPSLLKGEEYGDKKYPAVVLAHGGGGRAFKQWVEKWAAEGYAAIAFDMSSRDQNFNHHAKAGPRPSDSTRFYNVGGDIKKMWTVNSVAGALRAHSFLRSRPEIDTGKTAITGISWGGYITCIAAGIDNRFKAACPLYGCGFYNEMDFTQQYFEQMSDSAETLWMDILDPKNYLSDVACPILFINNQRDFYFSLLPFHKSYSLVPEKFRRVLLWPDMPHGHSLGWKPAKEVKYFFDNILLDKFPLPVIDNVVVSDSLITARCESPVSPHICKLWFTNDTISLSEHRAWSSINATIRNDSIIVSNPGEKMLFGFLHIDDHRGVTGSSELFFQH